MMAGGEVVLRKTAVGSSQRSRLSNITNFGPKGGVGNLRFGDEQKLCKSWNEGSVNGSSHATVHLQHQQEIKILQLALREKKAEIEAYKAALDAISISMEETQRDLEASLIRRAQQNDDIIAYNSHMAKELYSLREQLKLQQHEHTGMMMAYRISESDLQEKLGEVTEQLRIILQEKQNKGVKDGSTGKTGKRPESNALRRHTMGPGPFAPGLWNSSTKPKSLNDLYSNTGSRRGGREQTVRLPTLATLPTVPTSTLPIFIIPPKSSHLRYHHLTTMGPLDENESIPEPSASAKVVPVKDDDESIPEPSASAKVVPVKDDDEDDDETTAEVISTGDLKEGIISTSETVMSTENTDSSNAGKESDQDHVHIRCTCDEIVPEPLKNIPADMVPSVNTQPASKSSYGKARLWQCAGDSVMPHEGTQLSEEFHSMLMRRLGATFGCLKKDIDLEPRTPAHVSCAAEDDPSPRLTALQSSRARRKLSADQVAVKQEESAPPDHDMMNNNKKLLMSSKVLVNKARQQAATTCVNRVIKPISRAHSTEVVVVDDSDLDSSVADSHLHETLASEPEKTTPALRKSGSVNGNRSGLAQQKTITGAVNTTKTQPNRFITVKDRPKREATPKNVHLCKQDHGTQSKNSTSDDPASRSTRGLAATGRLRRRAAAAVVSCMESPI